MGALPRMPGAMRLKVWGHVEGQSNILFLTWETLVQIALHSDSAQRCALFNNIICNALL